MFTACCENGPAACLIGDKKASRSQRLEPTPGKSVVTNLGQVLMPLVTSQNDFSHVCMDSEAGWRWSWSLLDRGGRVLLEAELQVLKHVSFS